MEHHKFLLFGVCVAALLILIHLSGCAASLNQGTCCAPPSPTFSGAFACITKLDAHNITASCKYYPDKPMDNFCTISEAECRNKICAKPIYPCNTPPCGTIPCPARQPSPAISDSCNNCVDDCVKDVSDPNDQSYITIPVCTPTSDPFCDMPGCTAMICGIPAAAGGNYQPMQELLSENPEFEPNVGAPVGYRDSPENLYMSRCEFSPMNAKTYAQLNKLGGSAYVNSFRFGMGTSFSDFEEARQYLPKTDQVCALNPNGYTDRFTNYLTDQQQTVTVASTSTSCEYKYPVCTLGPSGRYTVCLGNGLQYANSQECYASCLKSVTTGPANPDGTCPVRENPELCEDMGGGFGGYHFKCLSTGTDYSAIGQPTAKGKCMEFCPYARVDGTPITGTSTTTQTVFGMLDPTTINPFVCEYDPVYVSAVINVYVDGQADFSLDFAAAEGPVCIFTAPGDGSADYAAGATLYNTRNEPIAYCTFIGEQGVKPLVAMPGKAIASAQNIKCTRMDSINDNGIQDSLLESCAINEINGFKVPQVVVNDIAKSGKHSYWFRTYATTAAQPVMRKFTTASYQTAWGNPSTEVSQINYKYY